MQTSKIGSLPKQGSFWSLQWKAWPIGLALCWFHGIIKAESQALPSFAASECQSAPWRVTLPKPWSLWFCDSRRIQGTVWANWPTGGEKRKWILQVPKVQQAPVLRDLKIIQSYVIHLGHWAVVPEPWSLGCSLLSVSISGSQVLIITAMCVETQ